MPWLFSPICLFNPPSLLNQDTGSINSRATATRTEVAEGAGPVATGGVAVLAACNGRACEATLYLGGIGRVEGAPLQFFKWSYIKLPL